MKIQVDDFIDEGGFGDIWSGTDELGRRVAIKTIREASQGISSAIQHAQALVRAKHPNVVDVYSIEELILPKGTEASTCIIMEYIDGEPLETLYKTSIDTDKCLKIGTQIIEGLRHIHNQGLVHGDFHDKNILVTKESTVKVIDILYMNSLSNISQQSKEAKFKYDFRSIHQVLSNLIFNSEIGLEGANEFRDKSGLGIPEDIGTIEAAFISIKSFTNKSLQKLADIYQIDVEHINHFKFRAECEIDVDELKKIMGRKCLKIIKESDYYPDTEVDIYTDLNLSELRSEMRKVDDGHVMLQTVQLKNNYTGERDYNLE